MLHADGITAKQLLTPQNTFRVIVTSQASADILSDQNTQSINAQAAAGDTKAYEWHRNGG